MFYKSFKNNVTMYNSLYFIEDKIFKISILCPEVELLNGPKMFTPTAAGWEGIICFLLVSAYS